MVARLSDTGACRRAIRESPLRGNGLPHRSADQWSADNGRPSNARPYGSTPSVSGWRDTPLTPPPCGARKTLRTFVCLRFSTAAEIPASLLNALPHLPFPGLFHDGPPTARLRRFRSRFFCHRQRVTGILPLAARSRNSPGGGGKAVRCVGAGITRPLGGHTPCLRAADSRPYGGTGVHPFISSFCFTPSFRFISLHSPSSPLSP